MQYIDRSHFISGSEDGIVNLWNSWQEDDYIREFQGNFDFKAVNSLAQMDHSQFLSG